MEINKNTHSEISVTEAKGEMWKWVITNKITRTGSDLFVLISACISRKRMKICFKRNASKAALDGVISAPFGAESTYTV